MFDKALLLPFHALRIVRPSGQDISSSGREAIVEKLHELHLGLGHYVGDDINKIGDAIGWTWEVSKGDYKGKFTTRLSKFWHENGKEIGPEQLEKIGTIAKAHFVGRQTLSLDFDDTLEWEGGDYGDSGSCYFGSKEYPNNSYARTLMRNFGCLAVRFYNGEKGVGRAWIYCPKSLDSLIAWNFTGRYSRVEGGRAMSELLGLPYKTISLSNRSNSSDLLYMSSESAVLIGPDKVDSYSLTKDFVEMCPCGKPGEIRPEKREKYCEICFSELFATCKRCEYTFKKEKVEGGFCKRCLERIFVCSFCGKQSDDPYTIGTQKVCPKCYREGHRKLCSICGLPSNERVETIEGGKVCPACAETKVTPCEICDKPSLVGKKRKTVDGMACRNCYVNYKLHKCGVCDKRHKQGEEDCEH